MIHYTSIEQSKKLLELGLSPESADMYYNTGFTINEYDIHVIHEDSGYAPGHDLPCWSVGALLQVIPTIYEDTYHVSGTLNGGALCEHGCTSIMFQEDTIIDACFEMVCWLLENKYITGTGI